MKKILNSTVKRLLPLFVGGNFLLVFLLTACLNDEDYSVSATDKLVFSTDTVAFDTVISGQPTHTYTFQVYNHNGKALRIPQVFLENGTESVFRVNVDGTFLDGGSATDFEIGSKDSLRFFLFVNPKEEDSDFPIKAEDKLTFVTEGGARQSVVLTAYGQAVIPLYAKRIERDTLLDAARPYQVFDSLVVAKGSTLTLKPGVKLYFHPEAELIVHGTLIAEGTLSQPVQFRGDRLGYMFSHQPYDRIPGQWGGITFTESSYDNFMNHCDIHSGTYGIRCDSSDVERTKLQLENSIVHNTSGTGISLRMSRVFVGNSQITNAGGNCLNILGGHNTFVHCTIGSFYAFTGGRGVALNFANADGDIRLPLHAADFANCLITGYASDEIMGKQSERYTEDAFNYRFINCLLNTPEYEDENLINCLWDETVEEASREKNFTPGFDLDKLIFSFLLNPASQAVNAADAEISRTFYPNDLSGRSRLSDDAPDIGCYEAQPEETTE